MIMSTSVKVPTIVKLIMHSGHLDHLESSPELVAIQLLREEIAAVESRVDLTRVHLMVHLMVQPMMHLMVQLMVLLSFFRKFPALLRRRVSHKTFDDFSCT